MIEAETADNTAYTLRAYALALGTLLPSVATSHTRQTLSEILLKEVRHG